ncbi:MAG TPA: hypothetical protein VFV40_04410 [Nocardioides sp.]|nr:hypothetical protein [Nocardioides sp.]
MTDDLRERLRAADPVAAATTDPSRIRTLAEAAMSTTLDDTGTTTPAGGRRTGTGLRLLAAAAALAAIGTAALLALGPDDEPLAAPETLELALPAGDVMSSCVQYSVEILADMPVAFAGTATDVGDGAVRLEVDRWYRGGSADVVELENPTGPMTSIDGVEFAAGSRYLVTASQDGTVNGCGYTTVWTEPMAQDFATAFGS